MFVVTDERSSESTWVLDFGFAWAGVAKLPGCLIAAETWLQKHRIRPTFLVECSSGRLVPMIADRAQTLS